MIMTFVTGIYEDNMFSQEIAQKRWYTSSLMLRLIYANNSAWGSVLPGRLFCILIDSACRRPYLRGNNKGD
jgi:hypothetical protein